MNTTQIAEREDFQEYSAIANALQPYLNSAKTGDGDAMRDIWFDHAHIVGSLDGKHFNLSASAFRDLINEIGGSADVQSRIVSIDYQGNAASARVEFIDWGGARYTDFLVLYKHDGHWKISGKVFDSHRRN